MKSKLLFILLTVLLQFTFAQNFPLRLSRTDNASCETNVKVKDEKFLSCGPYQMLYLVFIEDFDYKEDLPNNWKFKGDGKDDDFENQGNGHIWLGPGNTNNFTDEAYFNNVYASGGSCHFVIKKEQKLGMDPENGHGLRDYEFTGAFLNSFFKTKKGIVKAKIKWPENNLLWPGFWKRGENTNTNPNATMTQEIDIIEAWDANVNPRKLDISLWPLSQASFAFSGCDNYHQMKMHVHSKNNYGSGTRGRKFPLVSGFYANYHTYQCDFTDYRIDLKLDGTLVGYENKYYDGPYTGSGACYKHEMGGGIPNNSFGCNGLNSLPDCSFWILPPKPSWWPNWLPWVPQTYCGIWNKVDKDQCFPNTELSMDVRFSLAIPDVGTGVGTDCKNYPQTKCETNRDKLLTSWNNFSDIDKQFSIDRVEIWSIVNCTGILNMNTFEDFLAPNASDYTGFASAGSINIGTIHSTNFISQFPPVDGTWRHYPVHLLATNEIAFLDGNIEIKEGTYLRAEIIDCSQGSSLYAKTNETIPSLEETPILEEDIKSYEENQIRQYLNDNPSKLDSLTKAYVQQYYQEQIKNYQRGSSSETDNGSIIVYPNPTRDFINIDMVEEDFNDILYLEITNSLGQNTRYEKSKQIDLSNYSSGMYQLKFVFSHGFIVVKSITKL